MHKFCSLNTTFFSNSNFLVKKIVFLATKCFVIVKQNFNAMIIDKVLAEVFLLEGAVSEFSDDSRFIYMHSSSSCWKGFSNNIAVFDTIYNKLIILSPDETVTDLLTAFDEFLTDTWRPKAHIIDYDTLLILFNSSHTNENENSALLIFIQLNFSANSYSLLDHKLIRYCESSSLVKNDNEFLLIHEFSVISHEDPFDELKSLGYYKFFLRDNKISEIQGNRVVFNYDYENGG